MDDEFDLVRWFLRGGVHADWLYQYEWQARESYAVDVVPSAVLASCFSTAF